MVLSRWALACAGLALAAAACGRSVRNERARSSVDGGAGGGSGGDDGAAEPAPAGFRIEGGDFALTLDDCSALDDACVGRAGCSLERRVFVMRDGDELLLVYTSQGDMSPLPLEPAGDHFVLNKSLALTYLHEASAPAVSLSAGPFDVSFGDADADGVADTIRLEAAGTCETGSDDVENPVDVSVALTGSAGQSTPKLAVQGDGWLDPVQLSSNQPLDLGSTVALVAADGSRWAAGQVTRRSLYVTGFTIPGDLPSNTEFTFQIDAWNPTGGRAASALPFRTYDAWSALDDLGFEHGVDPHVVGTSLYACDQPKDTPRLAPSIGSASAIQGESSFLVPYGTNAAVLLDRPAGTTKLRLSVVPLHARAPLYEPLRLKVGNRRGKTSTVETQPSDELAETGDHDYPLAGPLQTLELPLPEERGDLLLEIQTPCMPESIAPYATAAWVDALEFE